MAKVNLKLDKIQDNSIPVDADIYYVIIKKSKLTPPKDKTKCPYMSMQFEITDGPFAGRRLYQNLTTDSSETKNGNQKNFMLYNLLKCLGIVEGPQEELDFDDDELLNLELKLQVELEDDPNDDSDEPKQINVIKRYLPMD